VESNIKIRRTVCEGYQENSAREIRPSLKTSGVSVYLQAACRNKATDGGRAQGWQSEQQYTGAGRDHFRRHVLQFAGQIDKEWREV
jgi:hypothetical protein